MIGVSLRLHLITRSWSFFLLFLLFLFFLLTLHSILMRV
jgi:hypothetical protein